MKDFIDIPVHDLLVILSFVVHGFHIPFLLSDSIKCLKQKVPHDLSIGINLVVAET
jgi:hypothetical protein